MGKLSQPYNATVLSRRKEHTIDTCSLPNALIKGYAEVRSKKPISEGYILYDSIYIIFSKYTVSEHISASQGWPCRGSC